MRVRKAIFPAAGLGTRFLPATKSIPKEMLTVIDKPLIHYAVEEAINAGIEELIFVTGRGKYALENYFDYSVELDTILRKRGQDKDLLRVNQLVLDPGNVWYTRQQEPLGLGHAVWCARNCVGNEPFAVLLADDLILGNPLQEMIAYHSNHPHSNVVGIMDVPQEDVHKYGIVEPASDNIFFEVTDLIEKPPMEKAPSQKAIVGRYILQPDIFSILETIQHKQHHEIQLTDALKQLLPSHKTFGYKFPYTRFDCGSRRGLLEANIHFALADPELRTATRTLLSHITKESS